MREGYEKQDVNPKKLAILVIISLVVVAIVVVLMNEFFIATKEALIEEMVLTPESVALRELRARETEILNSYGIVDAGAGIYRMPIERAMKLLAEEAYSQINP